MEEEYIVKCIVDPMSRKFYLCSDQGTEKYVTCETVTQFMDVLEVVRSLLDEETLEYVNPL